MQFRLISDTHNEFYRPETQYVIDRMHGDEERTLVIAGDFCTLKKASQSTETLTKLAKRFKHVVYVFGNHEFYHFKMKESHIERAKAQLNPEGLDNIHFLRRDSVVIDGIRFIGATMWTNMDRGHPVVQEMLKSKMNDFNFITYHNPDFNSYRKFRPQDWIAEHRKDFEFVRATVEASAEPCVVVTHHAPSTKSLDPRFDWDIYGNFGYHSDLSEFILDHPQIRYWCHGHIHKRSDYVIGETIVACNPYGYPDENPDDIDFIGNFFYTVY